MIPMTAVKREGEYNIKMNIDITRYGMPGQGQKYFTVNKVAAHEGQNSETLGSYLGSDIKVDVNLRGRDIVLLEIKPQNESSD